MHLLLILLSLYSFKSFAWGPKGQEITVRIAENFLTPKVSAKLMKITSNQKLSSFATWADQARNSAEWKETDTWHYINVGDDGNYQHGPISSPLDVQDAIVFSFEKLNSNLPDEQKLIWLKFLIHFVGDIHQPMHIGREADRGGNSTIVDYGKKMNLHFLWDSAILESRNLSVNDYVMRLSAQSRPTTVLTQIFDANIVIKENFTLRPFMYNFKNNKISSDYEKQALEIIDDRLWIGGLRLAQLLNSLSI